MKAFTLKAFIMTVCHILGYPRIGAKRELKKAKEAYWQGEISRQALETTVKELRLSHWQAQQKAGLYVVSVGDFAFYDQVLNVSGRYRHVLTPSRKWRLATWISTRPFAWFVGVRQPVSQPPPELQIASFSNIMSHKTPPRCACVEGVVFASVIGN